MWKLRPQERGTGDPGGDQRPGRYGAGYALCGHSEGQCSGPVHLQLYALQFFPVVNKEFYKSWKDLDGQDIVVHARGSGTEAIMNLMAKEKGIKYKNISYVPGSHVRALGLCREYQGHDPGQHNRNYVQKEAPGKFMVLPMGSVKASDEAIFATEAFLDKNQRPVESFRGTAPVKREIIADPKSVARTQEARAHEGASRKVEAEITPISDAAQNGIFPNGGGAKRAKSDLNSTALRSAQGRQPEGG